MGALKSKKFEKCFSPIGKLAGVKTNRSFDGPVEEERKISLLKIIEARVKQFM